LGLIELVLVLVVIGVVLWLVETQLPIDAGIKTIIRVVVIVVVVLWLLRLFVGDVQIPRFK
jgi:hypothetical protein